MECAERECRVGLHILHFPPSRTVHCFAVVLALFLAAWRAFYLIWRSTTNRTARVFSTLCIGVAWGVGWYALQPRDPYWINELSATTWVMATWHMADWLLWRCDEELPEHLGFGSFLLHEALVLRPHVLRHPPGRRPPTGRSMAQRVADALPFLGTFALQYVSCEVINAWLMQHEKEALLQGPLPHRLLASLAFAVALYFHLSFFFNIMAFLNIILFDQEPEDWPEPFRAPWAAASPTEFWNDRWHQMFRHFFMRLVYRPLSMALRALASPYPALNVQLPAAPKKRGSDINDESPAPSDWCIPASPHWRGQQAGGWGAADSVDAPAGSLRSRPAGRQGGLTGSAAQAEGATPRRSTRLAALTGSAHTPSAAPGMPLAKGRYAPTQASESTQRRQTTGPRSARTVGPRQHSEESADRVVVSDVNSERGRGEERRRGADPPWIHAVCVLAVFIASGLFHELTLFLFFGEPTGEQLAFFVMHGAVVLGERALTAYALRRAPWVARVPRWVWVVANNAFFALTTLIFMRPWFRQSYHKELRVPVPDPIHFMVASWSRKNSL